MNLEHTSPNELNGRNAFLPSPMSCASIAAPTIPVAAAVAAIVAMGISL